MHRSLIVLCLTVFVMGTGQVLVVDQAGREVVVPGQPARIASAFGVATAYLYPLINPEQIVAARYLGVPDHPLSQAVMARIDPRYQEKALGAEITAEELVARNVDLVFAGLKHKDLAQILAEVGIPTILIGPETFEGVQEATLLVGRALSQGDRAQALIDFYQAVLAAIAGATASIPQGERPKVLVLGTAALRVASGAMYQSRMIELAGGVSVTAGLPGSWQNVNIEQVMIWNPDVIVIVPYSSVNPADLRRDPFWAEIKAVKSGHVYKMPQLLFAWDTPIPESVLGILWLAELLHPGRVALSLSETIRKFYGEFYRCELSWEELSALLAE
ncbi:MAG: ABC transporter substrate-binding protein [Candidatus Bipolaricaulota bacterium]|nr:ABC transporter substrate-binding protein [Candidatus Bipolaricaulota bacterium]MDW8126509.1 ABC transporter substrate-binding protein [Candidatus Bipolaricaulota bacterium]